MPTRPRSGSTSKSQNMPTIATRKRASTAEKPINALRAMPHCRTAAPPPMAGGPRRNAGRLLLPAPSYHRGLRETVSPHVSSTDRGPCQIRRPTRLPMNPAVPIWAESPRGRRELPRRAVPHVVLPRRGASSRYESADGWMSLCALAPTGGSRRRTAVSGCARLAESRG